MTTAITSSCFFIAGAFACAVAASQTAPSVPRTDACAALSGLKVESGTVEGAERFSAGEAVVGGETAGAKVAENVCRARLRLQPVTGSDIKVEVWLPENWNNKLFGFGGAGFDGGLSEDTASFTCKALR